MNGDEFNDLMHEIAAKLPISLFVKDGETGRYLLCNTGVAEKFHIHHPESVEGHTDAELLDEKTAARFVAEDRKVLENGDPLYFHETLTDHDGVEHHFQAVKFRHVSQTGRPYLVGYAIDRTEQDQRLEDAEASIRSQLRDLGETQLMRNQLEELNTRLKRTIEIATLRADALLRISDGASFDEIFDMVAPRLLALTNCDQAVFTTPDGTDTFRDVSGMRGKPGVDCTKCPYRLPQASCYDSDELVLPDMSALPPGQRPPADCPVRSAVSRRVYCGDMIAGLLTLHHLNAACGFSDEVRSVLRAVTLLLKIALERDQAEHERAHYLEQIKAERDRAVAAERAKSFFFSTVSHDIRTPLNAIVGFAQMLKIGNETPEQRREAIDAIMTSSSTLLQLINDVLDLSKLEAGRMEFLPEPTEMSALVHGVADTFRLTCEQKGVALALHVKPMPCLELDPQRIRQILFNLVGNAVKFTESGSVGLGAVYTDGTLTLTVKDTGCGIAEEDLQKLAQPFVQVGTDSGKRVRGTGLGLSIVRQLVDRMGGSVVIRSGLGAGTEVTVTLPKVNAVAPARNTLSTTQRIRLAVTNVRNATLRILVVDDVLINRKVIARLLNILGHTDIVTVENGRAALDALRAHPFDLVLCDMWMPEMDGEEFIRRVRGIPLFANLPVYAVTADAEAQKDFVAMGFTGFLLKPVTIERLREIV